MKKHNQEPKKVKVLGDDGDSSPKASIRRNAPACKPKSPTHESAPDNYLPGAFIKYDDWQLTSTLSDCIQNPKVISIYDLEKFTQDIRYKITFYWKGQNDFIDWMDAVIGDRLLEAWR